MGDSYEITNEYTLTFDVTGATQNLPKNETVEYGEKVAKPTDPIRYGYKFLGWYTDNNTFNNPYNFDNAIVGNITLYANWEIVTKYNVTFNSNGGTEVTSQTVVGGSKVGIPVEPKNLSLK